MLRTALLFNRSQASSPALANGTYPTALSAALSEEAVYHPGLHETYPAEAVVTRAALGTTVKLKFQGTADTPNALLLGDSTARVALVALSSGQSIQTVQGVGASVSTSHVTAAGLTTITLATNALGKPAETPATFAAYILASLSATFAAEVIASGGVMGAMLWARPVPQAPRWLDIESTREDVDVLASEHTIDAGAGATIAVPLRVRTAGWRAIRCIAAGTGAPAAGDAVLVTMGVPG